MKDQFLNIKRKKITNNMRTLCVRQSSALNILIVNHIEQKTKTTRNNTKKRSKLKLAFFEIIKNIYNA